MSDRFEAVVIGSGFGGAINACRLAKKWPGKVVVLERGKRYGLGEFPRSPYDFARNFWALPDETTPRPKHVRKAIEKTGAELHGMYDVRNYDHIDVVICAGVGGGSLIYANVFLEPPDEVFDDRWPQSCKKTSLAPYYDVAKKVLGSRPVPIDGDPRRQIRKTELFREAARAMNRDSQLVDINVFFGNNFDQPLPLGRQEHNRYGAVQTSCTYCGECICGCNYHAKNTLDLNYLYAAENYHGTEIRIECNANAIIPLNESGLKDPQADGSHGYCVEYTDLNRRERRSLLAKRVVVSAGSLGSTEILLRCKHRTGTLPRISSSLGQGFSGNGDFLSFVVEGFDGRPNYGPTITQRIDCNLFRNFARDHAFIVEDASYPVFLAWFVEGVRPRWMWLKSISRVLRDVLTNWTSGKSPGPIGFAFADLLSGSVSNESAVLLSMGLDQSNGTMELDAGGYIKLRWPWRDSRTLYDAMLDAAKGFKHCVNGKIFAALPTWDWPIRNNITVHPLGGCGLADDPARGVTSAERRAFGQVFGYRGLYVADGAIVPTAVGANPTATICALSELVAEGITQISPDASLK